MERLNKGAVSNILKGQLKLLNSFLTRDAELIINKNLKKKNYEVKVKRLIADMFSTIKDLK